MASNCAIPSFPVARMKKMRKVMHVVPLSFVRESLNFKEGDIPKSFAFLF